MSVVVAVLPTCVAAEQPGQQPRKPLAPRQAAGNPCAAFGPGFIKVEGSSTCVKVGGSISIGAGGSR